MASPPFKIITPIKLMTEDNNPKPTKKTSAVPLRKETVRVTLKSNPNERDADTNAGAPPEPAPTIPLKSPTTGAPAVPPPSPATRPIPQAPKAPQMPATGKLQTSSQAKNPIAAPTVAASTFAGAENLVPPPKPSTLKIATPDFAEPVDPQGAEVPEPAPTVSLATPQTPPPVGASSQPLPKATVQIQPTESMAVPDASAAGPQLTTARVEDLEEAAADRAESTNTVFSIVALVAAVILLGLQLGTANIWVNDESLDNPGWGRLFD